MHYVYFDLNCLTGVGTEETKNSLQISQSDWETLFLNPKLLKDFAVTDNKLHKKKKDFKELENTFHLLCSLNFCNQELSVDNKEVCYLQVERKETILSLKIFNCQNEVNRKIPFYIECNQTGRLLQTINVCVYDLVKGVDIDISFFHINLYSQDIFWNF